MTARFPRNDLTEHSCPDNPPFPALWLPVFFAEAYWKKSAKRCLVITTSVLLSPGSRNGDFRE